MQVAVEATKHVVMCVGVTHYARISLEVAWSILQGERFLLRRHERYSFLSMRVERLSSLRLVHTGSNKLDVHGLRRGS